MSALGRGAVQDRTALNVSKDPKLTFAQVRKGPASPPGLFFS